MRVECGVSVDGYRDAKILKIIGPAKLNQRDFNFVEQNYLVELIPGEVEGVPERSRGISGLNST